MSHTTKLLYEGQVVRLGLESLRLPNGKALELEVVRHPGGAAVVALDAGDRVCLLSQTRHEWTLADLAILACGGVTVPIYPTLLADNGARHVVVSPDGQNVYVAGYDEGALAVFQRDARGALRVCMEGSGHSKAELLKIGEELIGRVTQQYAYHRIVTELKERKMTIVDEQMTQDKSVKIRVRNW